MRPPHPSPYPRYEQPRVPDAPLDPAHGVLVGLLLGAGTWVLLAGVLWLMWR